MNAKTLEAIRRHGEALLAAFPNATEKDPVTLCKKLRRIETSLVKPLTDYCNGDFDAGKNGERLDAICDKAKARVVKLLFGLDIEKHSHPDCACGLFINRDPRGYALKLDDEWTRDYNHHSHACLADDFKRIYTDMGGYGIIAPDLTQ